MRSQLESKKATLKGYHYLDMSVLVPRIKPKMTFNQLSIDSNEQTSRWHGMTGRCHVYVHHVHDS